MKLHVLHVDAQGVVRTGDYGQVLGYVNPEAFDQSTGTYSYTGTLQGTIVKRGTRDEVVAEIVTKWVAHRVDVMTAFRVALWPYPGTATEADVPGL